jgi:hypothetical protein
VDLVVVGTAAIGDGDGATTGEGEVATTGWIDDVEVDEELDWLQAIVPTSSVLDRKSRAMPE